MSTLFADGGLLARVRRRAAGEHHQSGSRLGLLTWLLARSETAHQRAALRDIADDPHLLRDLGLTRKEALDEADRPFWR